MLAILDDGDGIASAAIGSLEAKQRIRRRIERVVGSEEYHIVDPAIEIDESEGE